MSLATPIAIRTLQRKLYRKAKAEPAFRFYLLLLVRYCPLDSFAPLHEKTPIDDPVISVTSGREKLCQGEGIERGVRHEKVFHHYGFGFVLSRPWRCGSDDRLSADGDGGLRRL